MTEHAVGNKVVLCGTITAIEGDVALVAVDRAFPAGGTITVRLGKLTAGGERAFGEQVVSAIASYRRRTGRGA